MARAHHVKKARKDDPQGRYKAGESYWWWKFRHGGKHVSKTRPKRSQLTSSDKLSRLYEAQEQLECAVSECRDSWSDTNDFTASLEILTSALQEALEKAEEVRDEYQEAVDACEGGLGDSIQEQWLDPAEAWVSELESLDLEQEPESEDLDDLEAQLDGLIDELETAAGSLEL